MVARWRPVHLGQAAVLRGLCACSEHAVIGIGSSNRYDARSPFTVAETAEMIRRVLSGHAADDAYSLVSVPDLDDGPRWRAMVVEMLGPLDRFFTDNPYVASLLTGDYVLARPVELVARSERVPVDGTMVRRRLAQGEGWQELVPPEVVDYLQAERLDARFRQEFGLATLALEVAPLRTID